MFTRHVSRQLAAHVDGRSGPEVAQHLRTCPRCQAECEQVGMGMEAMRALTLVEAPPAIWKGIEAVFPKPSQTAPPLRWAWLAVPAAAIFALAAYLLLEPPKSQTWEVTRVVESTSKTSRIAPGAWIETDSKTRAIIKVGTIGSLEVTPNTRLEVLVTKSAEHRVALAHGEIHASISAPPRLFFVNTPAGTAVDLGCEYDLKTSDDGSGLLRVTKGWVSFEFHALESLVPAGASCRTLAHAGPGIPFFDDASERFQKALDDNALSTILNESRGRDTLSLWHLLSRVEPTDRARVFDRIAALTPIPQGISREQALKLDPATLKHLREELAWTW